jgi:hypothetical protein
VPQSIGHLTLGFVRVKRVIVMVFENLLVDMLSFSGTSALSTALSVFWMMGFPRILIKIFARSFQFFQKTFRVKGHHGHRLPTSP